MTTFFPTGKHLNITAAALTLFITQLVINRPYENKCLMKP